MTVTWDKHLPSHPMRPPSPSLDHFWLKASRDGLYLCAICEECGYSGEALIAGFDADRNPIWEHEPYYS